MIEEDKEAEHDAEQELIHDTTGPTRGLPAPPSGNALAAQAKAGPPAQIGLPSAIATRRGSEVACSGSPSSASVAVPSADDLRKELFTVYRPDQEPLGQFLLP